MLLERTEVKLPCLSSMFVCVFPRVYLSQQLEGTAGRLEHYFKRGFAD